MLLVGMPMLTVLSQLALWMLSIQRRTGGIMRRGLLSMLGMVATGVIYRTIRRLARSQAMRQKVDQLQDRFRPLDTV